MTYDDDLRLKICESLIRQNLAIIEKHKERVLLLASERDAIEAKLGYLSTLSPLRP